MKWSDRCIALISYADNKMMVASLIFSSSDNNCLLLIIYWCNTVWSTVFVTLFVFICVDMSATVIFVLFLRLHYVWIYIWKWKCYMICAVKGITSIWKNCRNIMFWTIRMEWEKPKKLELHCTKKFPQILKL